MGANEYGKRKNDYEAGRLRRKTEKLNNETNRKIKPALI